MDWQKVERALARSFRARPQRFGESVVVHRRRSFSLAPALEHGMSADELNDAVDLAVWAGDVSELLEQEGANLQVLEFYWDGFGPCSWMAGMTLVGTGRRRYLCVWDEIDAYRVFAAVEPWHDPIALSAAVHAFISANGSRHGDWLFGGLPHEVSNLRPDLVPTTVFKQALFDYMQWAESFGPGAWSILAAEHYGRLVEPNHLQRCLDLLETTPWADDGWLDELARESSAMPDHARQQLFDEWFLAACDDVETATEGER